ncbi:DNA polymerase III subunit delta' [Paramicrobacterium agarici]|uniref:DNA polymerase III subunit delta' n=1 Tax=Paramicrobacterium agarici TaxID=630514 RepID=UPI001150A5E6|nr:DNA polymerase III subunit delta' [Microbacterium agarici]TQO23748.1 DNA polymerase-3 subunit delta' [Microbacterium agarici]
MSAWDDMTGQAGAVDVLRSAASASSSSMTHAWLITGPPGSGRSNIAYAFAAALLSGDPDGDQQTIGQVESRTHPDLSILRTENVSYKIEEVRAFATTSYYSPSVGRYRVMVIEDADRMTERTSNVLLKALEEPPERTVWVLCAPSDADMLPTIRSRVRTLRLSLPTVDDVAALLQVQLGVDAVTAERAARLAQSHIGMAKRLATDADALSRRERTLRTALAMRTVTDAVMAAAGMLEIAGDDAKAFTAERDEAERESVLRSLGVEPGKTVPPALRSQLKALEDDQKRRATRSLRDGIDRILVDLLSLYRDITMVQLGRDAAIINREFTDDLRRAAESADPARTLHTMDAIQLARRRIAGNVAPALALEAALVTAIR